MREDPGIDGEDRGGPRERNSGWESGGKNGKVLGPGEIEAPMRWRKKMSMGRAETKC